MFDNHKAFLARHGRFCLSDDSHGVEQICTHYEPALELLERYGVKELWYFTKGQEVQSSGADVVAQAVPLGQVKAAFEMGRA